MDDFYLLKLDNILIILTKKIHNLFYKLIILKFQYVIHNKNYDMKFEGYLYILISIEI